MTTEFSDEIKQKIITEYTQNNIAIGTLANRYHSSFRTIKAKLQHWGIKTRSLNQAKKVAKHADLRFNAQRRPRPPRLKC